MTTNDQNQKRIRDETDFRSPGTEVTPVAPRNNSVRPLNIESAADSDDYELQDHSSGSNILNELDAEAEAASTMNTKTTAAPPTTPDTSKNSYVYDNNDTQASMPSPLADFVAQTDAHGIASTPRSEAGTGTGMQRLSYRNQYKNNTDMNTNNSNASIKRNGHGSQIRSPVQALHEDERKRPANNEQSQEHNVIDSYNGSDDTLLDKLRSMCCCFLLDEDGMSSHDAAGHQILKSTSTKETLVAETGQHRELEYGQDFVHEPPQALDSSNDVIKLLPKIHPGDYGKKCLVLDLDETLVHSSFRAVQGADFVIPVQIEDVVHFVYVAKRPRVDAFLTEMAKHYEIVIFTASLNKYADPLLDLLDPDNVIRSRLFRESCVFHEGNYVKDLSLLNRDLSDCIIVDNSPSSYIFHPENAIDCTSFIDDVKDTELDDIADFLIAIKNVKDVRQVCQQWRQWPNLDLKPYM